MPDHDTQISRDGIKSAAMVCAYCGYVGTDDIRLCPNDGTALKVMSQHSLMGKVISSLSHPTIVGALDFDVENGQVTWQENASKRSLIFGATVKTQRH